MLAEISKLENLYHITGSQEVKQELKASILKLNELDATSAAKYSLYAKQHYFKHSDKPNKVLVCVLAETVDKVEFAYFMFSKVGSLVSSLEDKVAVLFCFLHYINQSGTS